MRGRVVWGGLPGTPTRRAGGGARTWVLHPGNELHHGHDIHILVGQGVLEEAVQAICRTRGAGGTTLSAYAALGQREPAVQAPGPQLQLLLLRTPMWSGVIQGKWK